MPLTFGLSRTQMESSQQWHWLLETALGVATANKGLGLVVSHGSV